MKSHVGIQKVSSCIRIQVIPKFFFSLSFFRSLSLPHSHSTDDAPKKKVHAQCHRLNVPTPIDERPCSPEVKRDFPKVSVKTLHHRCSRSRIERRTIVAQAGSLLPSSTSWPSGYLKRRITSFVLLVPFGQKIKQK